MPQKPIAQRFMGDTFVFLSLLLFALKPLLSAQAQTILAPTGPLTQGASSQIIEPQVAAAMTVAQRDAALERLGLERKSNETLQNEVMSQYESDIKACEKKFTVTDCKLDVMAKKNAQMHDLKQVEHAIKAQERAIKAVDRSESLQNKQSVTELQKKEAQAKEHEKAFDQRMLEHEKMLQSHDAKRAGIELTPMAEDDLSSQQNLKATHSGKSLEEQSQAQAAYEKKQIDAKEHEAAVKRKLAEKTNPAAALPDPTLGNHGKATP
jgi:hypothetical protein